MADEKKKIREFEEATTIYEDDYLAIDGNIGKTRKIKPIRIGATYEIEDGDHEFTLVGSNGYEHTVAIPYDNVSMTQAEYNALTEEEKMDGTARFISDAISTDESELWGRVGRNTLHTDAQIISNAINEIKDTMGSGTLTTTSPTIIGGINELNSRLNVIGDSYSLGSKGVTSVPSNTDTVIYGNVLPQGKYILSAKIYCNVNNASCYLACGGLRQQLTCPNVAYMTLCGLITSNGTTETQLHFYQNSGSAQTRTDNFDDVYLVRIL